MPIKNGVFIKQWIGWKSKYLRNLLSSLTSTVTQSKKFRLAKFDIYWIEEPTCADDVLGHKHIAEQLKPHGKVELLLNIKKSLY